MKLLIENVKMKENVSFPSFCSLFKFLIITTKLASSYYDNKHEVSLLFSKRTRYKRAKQKYDWQLINYRLPL